MLRNLCAITFMNFCLSVLVAGIVDGPGGRAHAAVMAFVLCLSATSVAGMVLCIMLSDKALLATSTGGDEKMVDDPQDEARPSRIQEDQELKADRLGSGLAVSAWLAILLLNGMLERNRPEFPAVDFSHMPDTIKAGFHAALANLPPDAAWNHRAAVGTLAAAVAFMLLLPLTRLVSRSWAFSTVAAAIFSLGILQIAEIRMFSYTLDTCDAARSGLASSATLTTGEINAMDDLRCRLPEGFAMDRDMHRTASPVR